MATGGMIYIWSFITIGSIIQVKWRVLPQQYERLYYLYYWWDGLIKYSVEIASGGMIYIPSIVTIGAGIQLMIKLLPHQFERFQYWYYWWEGFMKHAFK
jgi:hypothetical protein